MTVQIIPHGHFYGTLLQTYYPRVVSNGVFFGEGYLTRTPTVKGSTTKYIFSTWLKLCSTGAKTFIAAGLNSSNYTVFYLDSEMKLSFIHTVAGAIVAGYKASIQVQRDFTQHGNLILAVDTTQVNESDRLKMFYAGKQISPVTATPLALNIETFINDTVVHSIGYNVLNLANKYEDYMGETILLDGGEAADPVLLFTEYNSYGIQVPKQTLSGLAYGVNGFYLDFGRVA